MIAYCGLDCSKCDGYLATQSGEQEKLQEVAEKWSKQFNVELKPEHVICDGCKANKRQCIHCATSCTIRKCCIEKELNSCIECDDFACEDLRFIIDHVPEAKENLEKLSR
ncbi:DUF3795 domain-containing protein [Candidatus Sumerlaeota bacterium]|nr:DUF3795 domain-containing protein [Candidatus Sumerlaeota bacterium]